jgi:hypothetical protein
LALDRLRTDRRRRRQNLRGWRSISDRAIVRICCARPGRVENSTVDCPLTYVKFGSIPKVVLPTDEVGM